MMRTLTLKEQQLISGSGDGNNGGDKETYRGIGYGAQANGFQPNLAATRSCHAPLKQQPAMLK